MSDIDFFRDDESPVQDGFVIDTQERAEWALRKIARAQAEIDRHKRNAQLLLDRIYARLEEIEGPYLKTIEAMEAMLDPWAAVEIAKAGGKKKSKDLLCGRVGYRKAQDRLCVEDEVAAVGWLEANGHSECVRVKKEVKAAEAKKLIEEKGEVPDGLRMIPGGPDRFYVEVEPLELEKR